MVPVTAAQLAIFIEHLKNPTSLAYNIPFIATVDRALALENYTSAVNETARCFEMLFSAYARGQSGVVFTLLGPVEVEMTVFTTLDHAAEGLVRHFDLRRPPLVRAGIVPYDGHSTHLLLDFHHIASDGVSLAFFVDHLCRALSGGSVEPHKPSFLNYALRLAPNSPQQDARLTRLVAPPSARAEWPGKRHTETMGKSNRLGYAVQSWRLDRNRVDEIRRFARQTAQTPFKVCYFAFLVTTAAICGVENFVSGFVSAGRDGPYSDAYGMFSKIATLDADMSSGRSIRDTLQRVSVSIARSIDVHGLQSRRVYRDNVKSAADHVVLDALFVFHNTGFFARRPGDIRFKSFWSARKEVQFGMVVNLEDLGPDSIGVQWEYSPNWYAAEDIHRFGATFEIMLSMLVEADLGAPLDTLLRRAWKV